MGGHSRSPSPHRSGRAKEEPRARTGKAKDLHGKPNNNTNKWFWVFEKVGKNYLARERKEGDVHTTTPLCVDGEASRLGKIAA